MALGAAEVGEGAAGVVEVGSGRDVAVALGRAVWIVAVFAGTGAVGLGLGLISGALALGEAGTAVFDGEGVADGSTTTTRGVDVGTVAVGFVT